MTFWERLGQVQARNDMLEHPFYVRWTAGELSRGELRCYAGQYRHAVVAIAAASAKAALAAAPGEIAATLREHALEEHDHIALWDGFADAVGAAAAQPLPETAVCAQVWSAADRPLLDTLVALYAIESAQPAIAQAKRLGLRTHYALDDPRSTAYFDVHVQRDHEHAAAGRAIIDQDLSGADEQRLLTVAESVLAANWTLLDGVQGG